jgi:signal transduction histidine kinase
MQHAFVGDEQATRELCHDLRQYVSAGLLLAQMPGDELLDSGVRERLETISQLFRHISDLVGARDDGGIHRELVTDLVELVDDCVRVVRLTREVAVVTELAGDAKVYGDPVMLRRAVANVLDNASRAAGTGGSVHVRVSQESDVSSVEICDDGLGFGHIPSVNGHGLSIVDTALRACQGRLEISSGPGPGTTVRMSIPAQRQGFDS